MKPGAGSLLERERETAAIDAALAEVGGGGGRVLLVRGPAGIGKSSLLAEIEKRARPSGARILRARGDDMERAFPFGVARQLFEPILADGDDAERASLLSGAAQLAASAVWVSEEPATVARSGDLLFPVMHGIYWLCSNLASERPVVMLVDDAQWADEQSLLWLAYLVRRLAGISALVVIATRVDPGASQHHALEAIAQEPCSRTMELSPLGVDAVGALMSRIADVPVPEAVASACHARTAGIPFVLTELTMTLAGRGIRLDQKDAVDQVNQVVPETVARSVLRRVDRLNPNAVALARAIAVLGTDVAVADAGLLAGLDGAAAANATDVLVAAGLLCPETPLRFVHPLVREAVYNDLPVGIRQHQHRRAADMLIAKTPPELAGAHLLECEPVGDQRSVSVLVRCGERAMARGAPETAVRYFSRALNEGPLDFVPVVLELGIAEARLGRSEAVQHLRAALALPKTASAACTATRELAVALAARGNVDEALDTLEKGVDALSLRDREQGLLLLGELCAIGQLYPSWTPRIAARVREVAPELSGQTAGERLVLAGYAHLRSNEGAQPDELADLAERALQDGRLLAEQTGDSTAVYLLIYVMHRAQREDLADRWLEAALVDTRARGSVFGTTVGQGVRGQLCWLRGELADAEADARVSLDAQLEAGWASVLPFGVQVLGECLLERGEPKSAVQLFSELGLAGPLPELAMYRWAQATRGRARVAAGDIDGGLADLLDCERDNMGTQTGLGLLWRTDVAHVLFARGEPHAARQLASEQLSLAEQFAVPRIQGIAQRTVGQLAETPDESRHWLTLAVSTLGASSARLEHARALVELGASIRRAGTPAAAREPLREGYELARRCGSTILVNQAADELAAAGVRLRRPALGGLDALTPSERRVAAMAASGMSNPEIAQALFLTRKTIEMHLGRAYRKLSVSGRSDLAGYFGG